MTGTVWNIAPDQTTVAVDSAIFDAVYRVRSGYAAKLWTLPHLNAVIAGGSWGGVIQGVIGEALVKPVAGNQDLRDRLPAMIRKHYRHFLDEQAGQAGLDLDENWTGCVFFLFEAGRGWLYGNESDFAAQPLPPGLWADPEVSGSCRVHEPFQGDAQLVRLMRRQMDDSSVHIGGPVIRATITHDGLALATIGNLDDPVTQPEPTASGLSRQQRRALARKQRKA